MQSAPKAVFPSTGIDSSANKNSVLPQWVAALVALWPAGLAQARTGRLSVCAPCRDRTEDQSTLYSAALALLLWKYSWAAESEVMAVLDTAALNHTFGEFTPAINDLSNSLLGMRATSWQTGTPKMRSPARELNWYPGFHPVQTTKHSVVTNSKPRLGSTRKREAHL